MPIPKPKEDEKKEEFVERCMVDKTMVAEYDEDQRYAICSGVYDEETEDINTKDMEENKEVILDEKRHIQKIEETEDSIIVYYGKSEKDVPMEEEAPEEIEEEIVEEEEVEEENNLVYKRNNPNKEVRTFNVQNLELREEGDSNVVVGYASVFNTLSNDLGNFKEIISKEAFEGRLNDDVRFLINHEGLPLARTTNDTLKLTTDETGLRYEAKVANTSTGRDLLELMRNGTINQSSFAFVVDDDSWEVKDGVNIRTINKVSRLYDVSAVTYPAYEEASVALRSMDEWKKEEEEKVMKENLKKEQEEMKKEEMDLIKRNLREMRLSIINKK
jgi:HK97 family phage prohead protease